MILLPAILAGLLAGWTRSKWQGTSWQAPVLRQDWLVLVFFVPQLVAFYLPITRNQFSDNAAAACLVISQFGLLLFCLANLRMPGISILALGLVMNLAVICANGGLMPISSSTAAQIVPPHLMDNLELGARFSPGSKDILLAPEMIRLAWLSDRFTGPGWFPYQFAFSAGDILISAGVFLLLALPNNTRKVIEHANQPAF